MHGPGVHVLVMTIAFVGPYSIMITPSAASNPTVEQFVFGSASIPTYTNLWTDDQDVSGDHASTDDFTDSPLLTDYSIPSATIVLTTAQSVVGSTIKKYYTSTLVTTSSSASRNLEQSNTYAYMDTIQLNAY